LAGAINDALSADFLICAANKKGQIRRQAVVLVREEGMRISRLQKTVDLYWNCLFGNLSVKLKHSILKNTVFGCGDMSIF
jgi:hypothetical protein